MSYRLIIRPEAELDIRDAFEWYEAQTPGLGSEFIRAIVPTQSAGTPPTTLQHPNPKGRWSACSYVPTLKVWRDKLLIHIWRSYIGNSARWNSLPAFYQVSSLWARIIIELYPTATKGKSR